MHVSGTCLGGGKSRHSFITKYLTEEQRLLEGGKMSQSPAVCRVLRAVRAAARRRTQEASVLQVRL